uniref:Uncharacterized protein n=1 Tax=Romanomermis culicivorax TaxID=13658 RepID=A0A915KL46_ROMCU
MEQTRMTDWSACVDETQPGSYYCSASKFTPSTLAEHARQTSPSTAPSMLATHAWGRSANTLLAEHARTKQMEKIVFSLITKFER